MQSKWQSFLEAKLNTLSGFFISWALMHWVIPLIWLTPVSAGQSFSITMLFTVVSVLRNYVIRRVFNGFVKK